MKKLTIVVAGGSGTRMGTDIPKQFLEIKTLPVLMHTLKRFHQYDDQMGIRLVLPEEQVEAWEELCLKYEFKLEYELFYGGETRFHSVKNGLENIPDGRLVAIHDGVRPLVSQETIQRCFEKAKEMGAVVPVIDINESVRRVEHEDSVAVDRTRYKLVQTPGVFYSEIIKDAYSLDYDPSFTDDATVVETAGYKIYMTEGNPENIKITSPNDLLIADALMGLSKNE